MSNRFKGLKAKTKTSFMGMDIEINKLSVNQVFHVRELIDIAAKEPSEKANMDIMVAVVKYGAPELSDLSDEEIQDFPIDDLGKFSNEILTNSGLGQKTAE
jgi:hypothetical protein